MYADIDSNRNVTDVRAPKPLPRIVISVPDLARVGRTEVIVGAGIDASTSKSAVLTPVPFAVVTAIGPVEAPVGTCAVRSVSELTT